MLDLIFSFQFGTAFYFTVFFQEETYTLIFITLFIYLYHYYLKIPTARYSFLCNFLIYLYPKR